MDIFLQGSRKRLTGFTKELGFRAVRIVFPDLDPTPYCFFVSEIDVYLKNAVENDLATADEAGAIVQQAREMDMYEDFRHLCNFEFAKILCSGPQALDLDSLHYMEFRICEDPAHNINFIMRHGHVFRGDEVQTEGIFTLQNGFAELEKLTSGEEPPLTGSQAVTIFQQMINSGLPHDDDEANAIWNAAPEEDRKRVLEAQAMVVRHAAADILADFSEWLGNLDHDGSDDDNM